MGEITIQPIRRLFKKAGAKRVSDKAAAELARILEEKAKAIAIEADKLSKHGKRKTVMKHDIKLAKKVLDK